MRNEAYRLDDKVGPLVTLPTRHLASLRRAAGRRSFSLPPALTMVAARDRASYAPA